MNSGMVIGCNLKIQRFSIEKHNLLFSPFGNLNGPETSIRVDQVSGTESNLIGNFQQLQNKFLLSLFSFLPEPCRERGRQETRDEDFPT